MSISYGSVLGKKCASTLMRHINTIADTKGDIVYLETCTVREDDKNVDIYKHFGFNTIHTVGPIGQEDGLHTPEEKVMLLTTVGMKRPPYGKADSTEQVSEKTITWKKESKKGRRSIAPWFRL